MKHLEGDGGSYNALAFKHYVNNNSEQTAVQTCFLISAHLANK
jgi:hypothetical protein